MQLEMTENDKKLLKMLSIFVIVVCIGYWGILPVIKDINAMKKDIVKQQDKRDENELKLVEIPMLEADEVWMGEKITEARAQYYPMMNGAEVDRYLTDMALSYGLKAYDLAINISDDETELEPYQYAEAKPEEEVVTTEEDKSTMDKLDDELDGKDSKKEEEVVFEDEPSTGIFTATVSFRLGGEKDKLQALLESLMNTDRKLRIVSYQWSKENSVSYSKPETDNESGEYKIVAENNLSIVLELYMCEE